MIRFAVNCVPIAQPRQRHRIVATAERTFAQNYTPAKHPVQQFKCDLRDAASKAYAGPPLDGAIILRVVFVLPRPRAMCWKTRPTPRVRHCSKPDSDNLLKALKDGLTKLVWRDDAQICHVEAQKWIASGDEQPGVTVEIEEVTA